MHPPPILGELAIAAILAVGLALILHRLRLPTTIAFLLAGAVAGPAGLQIVQNGETIQLLAEFGVVMLLFAIGMEFSLERLRFIWRPLAVGGTLQVALTTGLGFAILIAAGDTGPRAFLFAVACALSSTAIVLRALADREEVDSPHGKFTVGALIFQDLLVVPLTMIIPILGGSSDENVVVAVGLAIVRAALAVIVTIMVARILMPRVFAEIDRTRSRELFLLAVLGTGIGMAWLMSEFGLSLALGAFLAGVVLADTDYGERAVGEVLPIRDALTAVFFVSLGLLFDWRVFVEEPLVASAIVVALVLGKWLTGALAAIVTGFPARAAWLGGIYLSQFGEFGFVALSLGVSAGLVTNEETRLVVTAGVASMIISRALMTAAPRLHAGEAVLRPLERLLRAQGIDEPGPRDQTLSDHVVIVGFGVAGTLLGQALRAAQLEFIVLELNADRVRQGRASGYPIYYGDITSPEAQRHARVRDARALVLVINDPAAARRAIISVQARSPGTPIICRTHYVRDRAALLALGASEVICEELEGGTELATAILRRSGIGPARTHALILASIEEMGHHGISSRPGEWTANGAVDDGARRRDEGAPPGLQ